MTLDQEKELHALMDDFNGEQITFFDRLTLKLGIVQMVCPRQRYKVMDRAARFTAALRPTANANQHQHPAKRVMALSA